MVVLRVRNQINWQNLHRNIKFKKENHKMSSHTEASFNKYTAQGKGTLIGNWAEERSLREFSGVGR